MNKPSLNFIREVRRYMAFLITNTKMNNARKKLVSVRTRRLDKGRETSFGFFIPDIGRSGERRTSWERV